MNNKTIVEEYFETHFILSFIIFLVFVIVGGLVGNRQIEKVGVVIFMLSLFPNMVLKGHAGIQWLACAICPDCATKI